MVRAMLSESLVSVISQTLLKTKDGQGRLAAHEIMIGNARDPQSHPREARSRRCTRRSKRAQNRSGCRRSTSVWSSWCAATSCPSRRGAQPGRQQGSVHVAARKHSRAGACGPRNEETQDGTRTRHHSSFTSCSSSSSSRKAPIFSSPPAFHRRSRSTARITAGVQDRRLTPQHTMELVRSVMNDKQAAEFESTKECNFAIAPPGVGRFRVNAFVQQARIGMVLRTITMRHPQIRGARPAAGVEGRHHVEARHHDVRRRHGQPASRRRWRRFWATATKTATATSSRSRTRSSSSMSTSTAWSRSARSAWTPTVGRSALKNTLRQAPDVILIGEVRERETMDYAIAFAETGHLCLATLHANSTNQALDRDHQLLSRGSPRPAADGLVAQHPRLRRAAADSRAATAAAASPRSK